MLLLHHFLSHSVRWRNANGLFDFFLLLLASTEHARRRFIIHIYVCSYKENTPSIRGHGALFAGDEKFLLLLRKKEREKARDVDVYITGERRENCGTEPMHTDGVNK